MLHRPVGAPRTTVGNWSLCVASGKTRWEGGAERGNSGSRKVERGLPCRVGVGGGRRRGMAQVVGGRGAGGGFPRGRRVGSFSRRGTRGKQVGRKRMLVGRGGMGKGNGTGAVGCNGVLRSARGQSPRLLLLYRKKSFVWKSRAWKNCGPTNARLVAIFRSDRGPQQRLRKDRLKTSIKGPCISRLGKAQSLKSTLYQEDLERIGGGSGKELIGLFEGKKKTGPPKRSADFGGETIAWDYEKSKDQKSFSVYSKHIKKIIFVNGEQGVGGTGRGPKGSNSGKH